MWLQTSGDSGDEAEFRILLACSPDRDIRAGTPCPAFSAMADTGERVVPAHGFRYVAALQTAGLGGRLRLPPVDSRAGHGGGKTTASAIAEVADMWALGARWTGLGVTASP